MLFYDIHYSFYGEEALVLESIREDKFHELFTQLKLGVVVFGDDVILGISSLRKLSILERNYKELNMKGYFSDVILDTSKGNVIVENINCHDFDKDFEPYTKDITNDVIREYKLYGTELQFTYDFQSREFKIGDKLIHKFKEFSHRSLFMQAMFDKVGINKGKNFKEIYHYLDNSYDNSTLEPKQSKKIYDLKDKINELVLDKIKIKNFFVVEKSAIESEIIRKF